MVIGESDLEHDYNLLLFFRKRELLNEDVVLKTYELPTKALSALILVLFFGNCRRHTATIHNAQSNETGTMYVLYIHQLI